MSATNDGKAEFISLETKQNGFAYGLGSAVSKCTFRGVPLTDTLKDALSEMFRLKSILNLGWEKLDRDNVECSGNREVIGSFLSAASWAYALDVGLSPYQGVCSSGSTNPLWFFYLSRLEEIYTRCFAAINMFGLPTEVIVGEFGLIRDFIDNGGIEKNGGGAGRGISVSLNMYLLGYFLHTKEHPLAYSSFGNLMERIGDAVIREYPSAAKSLGWHLGNMLNQSFGDIEVALEAKALMLSRLNDLHNRLQGKSLQRIAA